MQPQARLETHTAKPLAPSSLSSITFRQAAKAHTVQHSVAPIPLACQAISIMAQAMACAETVVGILGRTTVQYSLYIFTAALRSKSRARRNLRSTERVTQPTCCSVAPPSV